MKAERQRGNKIFCLKESEGETRQRVVSNIFLVFGGQINLSVQTDQLLFALRRLANCLTQDFPRHITSK